MLSTCNKCQLVVREDGRILIEENTVLQAVSNLYSQCGVYSLLIFKK